MFLLVFAILIIVYPLLLYFKPQISPYDKHPKLEQIVKVLLKIDDVPHLHKRIRKCVNIYNRSHRENAIKCLVHQMEVEKSKVIDSLWVRIPFMRNNLTNTQMFKQHIDMLNEYLENLVSKTKHNLGEYVRPGLLKTAKQPLPKNFNDDF